MNLWNRVTMTFYDQWAAVKAWRARRADIIEHHTKPTYEPYPDAQFDPEIKVYVEARDVRGRLLREYVYLEGYSLHQLNFRWGAKRGQTLVGEWVWLAVIEANTRLAARLDEVREQKESSHVPK